MLINICVTLKYYFNIKQTIIVQLIVNQSLRQNQVRNITLQLDYPNNINLPSWLKSVQTFQFFPLRSKK